MQSNLEKEAKEDEEQQLNSCLHTEPLLHSRCCKDTHEKMQCWCKTNGDEKAKSIEEAQTHIKVHISMS